MQFKHPEVFYFLVLLLIPILVHLFQLQKFKKIAFTNVAFLKKISLETRKSSQLKKWLILATRLLGLLAILFVFSQPYFSDKKVNEKNHNIIYLDNSLSLNTNGSQGNQLKIVAQEIIKNASDFDEYTLLTNDNVFENLTKNELDEELKRIDFTSKKSNLAQKITEIQSKKINETKTLYKSVLLSDFQFNEKINQQEFTNVNTPFSLVKIDSKQKNNISLDSIFISNSSSDQITISAIVRNQGEAKNDIPIALYNQDQLLDKRSFSIAKDKSENIEFTISKNTNFEGKIQVTYNDIFLFDNVLYFTINTRDKTQVLSIGEASNSLSRIYSDSAFEYKNYSLQNIDYNSISNQQLIILNQLKEIPNVLQTSLEEYVKDGGHILIIPNQRIELPSYNSFFSKFSKGRIENSRRDSLKITTINFDHPLYSDVFSKKVQNFQFPSTSMYYSTSLRGNSIVSYENKDPFLLEVNNPYAKIYWFSAPLDINTTNFSNSPLIVPTLFNIAQQSIRVSQPYYILQQDNTIEINKKLGKDEILSISNNTSSFIPLQQSFANKVQLNTNSEPSIAGFYQIQLKDSILETIAYNTDKDESTLNFYTKNELENLQNNFKMYDSVEDLFTDINEKNEVQWLWKLFLAIAIVSLLLEILILKFFRT